jgi:hypothetical protein
LFSHRQSRASSLGVVVTALGIGCSAPHPGPPDDPCGVRGQRIAISCPPDPHRCGSCGGSSAQSFDLPAIPESMLVTGGSYRTSDGTLWKFDVGSCTLWGLEYGPTTLGGKCSLTPHLKIVLRNGSGTYVSDSLCGCTACSSDITCTAEVR